MRKRVKNIISAILLLALSACLILWKLEVFNIPIDIKGVGIWGLIISIALVIVLVNSIIDLFYPGIFFPIAGLCIIFDDALGITAITPWIVLIVALLLSIAFEKLIPSHWIKKKFFRRFFDDEIRKEKKHDPTIDIDYTDCSNGNSENSDNSEYIMHSIKMGEGTRYISSKKLKKAELNCHFGQLTAFFDKAQAPDGHVNIECKVAFGEIQIYIPKEWNVVNKVSVSMGDCTDRSGSIPGEEGGVTCVIDGSVSFGDLVITKV